MSRSTLARDPGADMRLARAACALILIFTLAGLGSRTTFAQPSGRAGSMGQSPAAPRPRGK